MGDDEAAVAAFLAWSPRPVDLLPFPETIGWDRHMRPDGFNEYPTDRRTR